MSRIVTPRHFEEAAKQADAAAAGAVQLAIASARAIYAPLAIGEIRRAVASGNEALDIGRLRAYARLAQIAAMAQLEPFGVTRIRDTPDNREANG